MNRPYFEDSPEFVRLLRGDDQADLTRIALEVARDAYPEIEPVAYLARLDALAARVRDRCRDGAKDRQILKQINWVLFVEEKFRGNEQEYYDPRNSYLSEVLDRRLGIPISLAIVYLAVADRIGLAMAGVNLPAHFVIRAGRGDAAVWVDPYHGGELLDRDGCERLVQTATGQEVELTDAQLAPCSTATVVLRMLRNLKAVYLRDGEFVPAVPVLRRLAALAGDDPVERRDLGVACLHADRPGEAIDHLDAYLAAFPEADDVRAVTAMMKAARRQVAAWN